MDNPTLSEVQRLRLKNVTMDEFLYFADQICLKERNKCLSIENTNRLRKVWKPHHETGTMVYKPALLKKEPFKGVRGVGTTIQWAKAEGLLFNARQLQAEARAMCPKGDDTINGEKIRETKDPRTTPMDVSNGWYVDHYLQYCANVAQTILNSQHEEGVTGGVAGGVAGGVVNVQEHLRDDSNGHEQEGMEQTQSSDNESRRGKEAWEEDKAEKEANKNEEDDELESIHPLLSTLTSPRPPTSSLWPLAPKHNPVTNKRPELHDVMMRQIKKAKTMPAHEKKALEDEVRKHCHAEQKLYDKIESAVAASSMRATIKLRSTDHSASSKLPKSATVFHHRKSAIVLQMEIKVAYEFIRKLPMYKDRDVRMEAVDFYCFHNGKQELVRTSDIHVLPTATLPGELNEVKTGISASDMYSGYGQLRVAKLLTSAKHSTGYEDYLHNIIVPEEPRWWHQLSEPEANFIVVDGLKAYLQKKREDIKAMVKATECAEAAATKTGNHESDDDMEWESESECYTPATNSPN